MSINTVSSSVPNLSTSEKIDQQSSKTQKTRHTFSSVPRHSTSCMVRVLLVVCLLFNVAVHAMQFDRWDCPAPQGSYNKSCNLMWSHPYISADTNLAKIKFCKYVIDCKKVNKPDNEKQRNEKFLPREDISCADNWENCDGYLIGRKDTVQMCTDKKSIKAQLEENGIIAHKDEL